MPWRNRFMLLKLLALIFTRKWRTKTQCSVSREFVNYEPWAEKLYYCFIKLKPIHCMSSNTMHTDFFYLRPICIQNSIVSGFECKTSLLNFDNFFNLFGIRACTFMWCRFHGLQLWQRLGPVPQHDQQDGRPGVRGWGIQAHVLADRLRRSGLHASLLSHLKEELGSHIYRW